MEIKNKIINFLGDSITEGAGTTAPDKVYFEVLKQKYGLKAANGYGIGGTRIARQKVPSEDPIYDRYFLSRIDDMDKDADIIAVFGGSNDYGHGDAPLGCTDDRSSDTFYGACHELYCALINKYPGKTIIVMTPLHRADERVTKKNGVPVTLGDYVKIIKETAEYYSIPVCDLYAMSGICPQVPALKDYYTVDGLHPNDKGNMVIADRLAGFLMSL